MAGRISKSSFSRVSDEAYGSSWNGVTNIAPSKNAVYDKIESLGGGSDTLKVAVIGDSFSQHTFFRDSWPSQFELLCNEMGLPVTVENYAVCGATFDSALNDHTVHESGTRSQVEQVIAHGADFVFVMLGINDAILVGGKSANDIIDDAEAVYNALHAGLPDVTVFYIEELPHVGGSFPPTNMKNSECIPWSHKLIDYHGKSNCRVNNDTYLNTVVDTATQEKHDIFGTASAVISCGYDGGFTADIYKISKMGSCTDHIGHVDTFGHMMIAHYALRWFKDHNGIDDKVLDIGLWTDASDKHLIDPDELYLKVVARSEEAARVGRYLGIDLFARAEGWFYEQRHWRPYIGPPELASACWPFTITMDNCHPGRPIWLAWDTNDFIDANKETTDFGDFKHVWVGTEVLTDYDWSPGTKNLAYAVELADGTFDVYTVPIELTLDPTLSHVRATQSDTLTVPHNVYTLIPYSAEEYDTLDEFLSGRFTARCPGYYDVKASICTSGAHYLYTGDYIILAIYKSGTAVAKSFEYNVVEAWQHVCLNCITSIQLDKDDYVEVKVFVWHSDGMTFNNSWGCTLMSIDRLPM